MICMYVCVDVVKGRKKGSGWIGWDYNGGKREREREREAWGYTDVRRAWFSL